MKVINKMIVDEEYGIPILKKTLRYVNEIETAHNINIDDYLSGNKDMGDIEYIVRSYYDRKISEKIEITFNDPLSLFSCFSMNGCTTKKEALEKIRSFNKKNNIDTDKNNLENQLFKLYNKMVDRFGEPPEHGTFPSLQDILDMWLFYKDNSPQIEGFHDDIGMKMSMHIEERKAHLVETAFVVYNVNEHDFGDMLLKHVNENKIPNIEKNSQETMNKRIEQIEMRKMTIMTENMNEKLSKDPSARENFRKFITEQHMKKNNGKPHCALCGDNEDEIRLIKIVNHNHSNKNLCRDCMLCQIKEGIKFSKIKNGESKIIE